MDAQDVKKSSRILAKSCCARLAAFPRVLHDVAPLYVTRAVGIPISLMSLPVAGTDRCRDAQDENKERDSIGGC